MGNFISGAYTPHPNSLMFNTYPVFWPFKAFWFFRKVSHSCLIGIKFVSSEKLSCSLISQSLPKVMKTISTQESTSRSVSITDYLILDLNKLVNNSLYNSLLKSKWKSNLLKEPSVSLTDSH